MDRLESAERRFFKALDEVERDFASARQARDQAERALVMANTIETKTENAIKQLRDLVRSGEGGKDG